MQNKIIRWYSKHKRDLPWRSTSPWGVLVSEFMLQQTPVSRVLPIWSEWMERWPTPAELASSSKSEAIRAWGNLGYPRRVIRLHETAKEITKTHDGKVPDELEILRSLPGIGEYTSAAILAFGFRKKALVLDTNIRRLFFRMIDGVESPPSHITNVERQNRSALIPIQASKWAEATMELGALICTARNPICDLCPVRDLCWWRKKNYPRTAKAKLHHVWQGSNRQCRGIILKNLRSSTYVTKEIISQTWPNHSQLVFAIDSLIKDGIIKESEGKYMLVE